VRVGVRVSEELISKITTIAKALRKGSTDAESLLWKYLRRKQFAGHKFRRQQPIDHYIVDFVCFEKRIIVEVDGGQHSIEREKDAERESYLTRNGFEVLRFWNNEVLQNMEGVLEEIMKHC
jgi:very-short-patch-repair endonuclease